MLKRIRKKNNSKKITMATTISGTTASSVNVAGTYNVMGQGGSGGAGVPGAVSISNGGSAGQILTSNVMMGTTYWSNTTGHAVSGSTYAYNNAQSTNNVLTLHGTNNKELVKIEKDGTVKWADDATVDDAATAFAKSLSLGTERAAGITYNVKQRMRDAVFEEIISMAKEKGSLTPDDLTYLWQAAKIMDKLKGVTE